MVAYRRGHRPAAGVYGRRGSNAGVLRPMGVLGTACDSLGT